jgi:hypothetical protein
MSVKQGGKTPMLEKAGIAYNGSAPISLGSSINLTFFSSDIGVFPCMSLNLRIWLFADLTRPASAHDLVISHTLAG